MTWRRLNFELQPSLTFLVLILLCHGLGLAVIHHAYTVLYVDQPLSMILLAPAALVALISLWSSMRHWAGIDGQVVKRLEIDSERKLLWLASGRFLEIDAYQEVLVWRHLVIAKLVSAESGYWFIAFADALPSTEHRQLRAYFTLYGNEVEAA